MTPRQTIWRLSDTLTGPVMRIALLVLAVSVACGRPATVDSAARARIAAEIEREVRDAYDLSKPDVEKRFLSLYPDTGRIVSSSAGQMITSRDTLFDGIRYFWRNIGVNMQNPVWMWDRIVVDVLAPDAAVMTAAYHVPHLTPVARGSQPHVIGGAWTAVFRKENGRWVIVQEHLSDAPAAVSDSAHARMNHDTTGVDR